MKKLFPLLLMLFISHEILAQYLPQRPPDEHSGGVVVKYIMEDYKDFKEYGDFRNGEKDGYWQTIGIDSTVYVSGSYIDGMQVGLWTVNYPDGSVRYTEIFDSLGWPVEWNRYYNTRKVVSIFRPQGFSEEGYEAIIGVEARIFNKEFHEYQTGTSYQQTDYQQGWSYNYYEIDVVRSCSQFDLFLKASEVEYVVIEYTYPDELISREYVLGKNAIARLRVFEYKNKKLKKVEYYEYEKQVKTETYDKEGNVAKVKEY